MRKKLILWTVFQKTQTNALLRYEENPYRPAFFKYGVLTDYWVMRSSSLGSHCNYFSPFHPFPLLEVLQFSAAYSIAGSPLVLPINDKQLLHAL
jgi:hypothetical protein